MGHSNRYSVTLNEAQSLELAQESLRTGRGHSEIIRQWVGDYLASGAYEAYQAARRAKPTTVVDNNPQLVRPGRPPKKKTEAEQRAQWDAELASGELYSNMQPMPEGLS